MNLLAIRLIHATSLDVAQETEREREGLFMIRSVGWLQLDDYYLLDFSKSCLQTLENLLLLMLGESIRKLCSSFKASIHIVFLRFYSTSHKLTDGRFGYYTSITSVQCMFQSDNATE